MSNETKYLELKAELLVEGVKATPGALKEMGKKYKEQNHGLFGWDFEDHVGLTLPDDFLLPDGTVVQFRKNAAAPYEVRLQAGEFMLFRGEEPACPVRWLPRPEYYDKLTSNGHKMVKIGQIGGEDCLFFCYQNYCSHFSKGSNASSATWFPPHTPMTRCCGRRIPMTSRGGQGSLRRRYGEACPAHRRLFQP